jgi:hypothetical protein
MLTYEFQKYAATADTALEVILEYGVAIIPSVLSEEDCARMNAGMWDTLEHLTQRWEQPIHRADKSSWRLFKRLYPLHSMIIQQWEVGHAKHVWEVRQNRAVVNVFAEIWKTKPEDLLVSFDAIAVHLPSEETNIGWYRNNNWLHSDQSYTDNHFRCVQGWVTGYDVNEGDATLTFLEGSNRMHKQVGDHFKITEKDNWYKLTEEQTAYYTDNGCALKRIKCPKGSLVLWDSRTIHCGGEPMRGRQEANMRNIVYVCYQPRAQCDAGKLKKKREALREKRMTTHWPCNVKLFPKMPRTYGNPVYPVEPMPDPEPYLNLLGRRLAGFDV